MTENFYLQKKNLLEEMKLETLQQLQALQQEDAEHFLERVEKCERIIALIQRIDATRPDFSLQQKKEMKSVVEDIMRVRQQIDPLMRPFYEKLQRLSLAEKQRTVIKQRYGDEEAYQPSVFFDKKN